MQIHEHKLVHFTFGVKGPLQLPKMLLLFVFFLVIKKQTSKPSPGDDFFFPAKVT